MKVQVKAPFDKVIQILQYFRAHPQEMLSAKEVATEVRLTNSYVMKLLGELKRAGILDSNQGRYGGFFLSRPAERITMLDILSFDHAVATPLAAIDGFVVEPDHGAMDNEDWRQNLAGILNGLDTVMSQYLQTITLADM